MAYGISSCSCAEFEKCYKMHDEKTQLEHFCGWNRIWTPYRRKKTRASIKQANTIYYTVWEGYNILYQWCLCWWLLLLCIMPHIFRHKFILISINISHYCYCCEMCVCCLFSLCVTVVFVFDNVQTCGKMLVFKKSEAKDNSKINFLFFGHINGLRQEHVIRWKWSKGKWTNECEWEILCVAEGCQALTC